MRRQRWLEFKRPIPRKATIALGVTVWVIFFALWEVAVALAWVNAKFMPPPHVVVTTLYEMLAGGSFVVDIGISIYRIFLSFTLACLIAVPLGIVMGSFRRVEAFFNPLVSAWRYLPAPSFIPLLLMWFGTGDTQKIALLFIGVLWFLITIIMDHVKAVRAELIETSMTLGGNRWQILRTVVVPAAMPNIVVAMRQMLASELVLSRHRRDRRGHHRHRCGDDARQALSACRSNHGEHHRDRSAGLVDRLPVPAHPPADVPLPGRVRTLTL